MYWNLLKISVIVVVSCLIGSCSTLHEPSKVVYSIDYESLKIIPDSGIRFVIFFNEYSCHDCFPIVCQAIKQLQDKYQQISVFVVARSQQSKYTRIKTLRKIMGFFSNSSNIFFDQTPDVPDPWPPINVNGGLFSYYEVSKTPSVLIISNKQEVFFQYENLFDKNNLPEELETISKKIINVFDDIVKQMW